MVFLVRGRAAENIEGKIKTDGRKTLINEDKEKRRIQGKLNNNNENLWFYLFIKNYILLKNIVVKGKKVKGSLYHHTYSFYALQDIWNAVPNDTPKLNIYKYNSHNITQIYINRLSLTMQIFIAMNYLMLEKYLHFKKRQKHVSRIFFSPRRSNWIHVFK